MVGHDAGRILLHRVWDRCVEHVAHARVLCRVDRGAVLPHSVPKLDTTDQEHALDPSERVADRLRLVEVSPANGGAAIGEVREGLRRAGQEHNVAGVESVDDEPRRLAAEVARCTGDGNNHGNLRHS